MVPWTFGTVFLFDPTKGTIFVSFLGCERRGSMLGIAWISYLLRSEVFFRDHFLESEKRKEDLQSWGSAYREESVSRALNP